MAEKDGVSVVDGIAQIQGEVVEPGTQPQPKAVVVNAFEDEDAELVRLQAQVEAEAAGKTGAAAKADEPGTQGSAAAPAASATPAAPAAEPAAAAPNAQQKDTPQIAALKRALFVQRSKRQQAEQVATVMHGQIQVLTAVAGKAGLIETPAAKQAAPTPEETLADIDAQIIQAAQDYDDGKITLAESKKRERELVRQSDEIRMEQFKVVHQPAQTPEPASDLGLEQHLETLLTTYPILENLSDEDLAPIEALAYKQAEREGKPIQRGALGTKDLRERIGKLATNLYPGTASPPAAAAGAAAPGTQPGGTPAATPQLSPAAAAREQKLALAANHPPNIGTIGAGAPGGEKTESEHLAAITALGGDEDAVIRYITANPGLSKVMQGVF